MMNCLLFMDFSPSLSAYMESFIKYKIDVAHGASKKNASQILILQQMKKR